MFSWVDAENRHHLSSLRHGTHKAATNSLQRTRSCAAFRISLQARFMDFRSFSADLLQVVLGLPRCLFPSGVQNNPSLETLLGPPPQHVSNPCPFPTCEAHHDVFLFTDVAHFKARYFLWPSNTQWKAEAFMSENPQLSNYLMSGLPAFRAIEEHCLYIWVVKLELGLYRNLFWAP